MHSEPVESKQSVNGVEITVWEWEGTEPAVFLCHATGFHGRCWDQVVRQLGGRRCIAMDARGHGRSSKPAPPYHWREFAKDVAGVAAVLGVKDAVAVGHSMGGHSVTLAASLSPSAFAALLLIDPVIFPESAYQGPGELLDFVLRRRNVWESPGQMFRRFQDKAPFDSWDRQVLRDYCDYALEGAVLACSPEVEASIYSHSTARESNIHSEIAALDLPVHVLRAREPYEYGKFDGSPTWPDLAAQFRRGTDQHLTQSSHFIPMESPALTAELILRLS